VNQLTRDAIVRGSIDLDLSRAQPQHDRFLWQTMQLFGNLSWISLGSEQGDSLGIWRPGAGQDLQISGSNRSTEYFGNYYAMNQQGQRTVRLKVEKPAYDPRSRPWYKEAVAAKQPIWTKIYAGFTPGTIFIAASQPLYSQSGKLLGTVGTDISLSNIQQFLVKNPVSPTGQVFLIERSGLLVASSSPEPPFRLVPGQSPVRVDVRASQTPLTRSTARLLHQRVRDFGAIRQSQKFNLDIEHKRHFVQVVPFSLEGGLDWVIVIVVPESDVMGRIQAGTRTTIGLCLGLVMLVIVLNTWLSRQLLKPIQAMSRASQQITQGEVVSAIADSDIREFSSLARSFNHMSQEIQESRAQLEDYSRSLAQKVADRTAELQQEVQHRAAAEAALQVANQQLRRLAYLDGLTQIANRRLFDERLQHEWHRLKREQLPLSLILCDVDYFKQYNDTYGHQMGDDCLRIVAQAIAACVRRPADLAARYGGEEFVVLLPNTDTAGAIAVAKTIQGAIKHHQIPHETSAVSQYLTASLGVASVIPTDTMAPTTLLLDVDRALYQAKLTGRDRIWGEAVP
jgi:diguanylate cyclase (GGDEF)-like protein